jgi:hypothetical protein
MIRLKRLLETQLIKEALPLDMARNFVNIKRNPEIEQQLDAILNAIKQRPDAKSSRRGDRVAIKFESKEVVFDPDRDSLSYQFINFYPVLKRHISDANLYSQRENFDRFELPDLDQIIYGQPKDAYGRTTKMSKFIAAVIAQAEVKAFVSSLERHVEIDANGNKVLVGRGGSRPFDEVVTQVKQDAKKKIDELVKLYDEIPEIKRARENKTKTFYIVFSKHAYDVAGMSTNRGWTSCMNLYSGINKHYIQYDVADGTMVAYLVANDDLNIKRPVARVAIKPFVNTDDSTDVFYEPEEKVYGSPPHTFLEAVDKIINEAQPGKRGRFKMVDTLYCDSKRQVTKYGTANIEQLVANMLKRKQVATTTDEVYYILDNYAVYNNIGTLQFSDADKLYVDAPSADINFSATIPESDNPTYCPIQFKRVSGLRLKRLSSFDNFPEQCNRLTLIIPQMTDFTGCPTAIRTLSLIGGTITSFTGLQSVQEVSIVSYSNEIVKIQSFNGLPKNITKLECLTNNVNIDVDLQDLIRQLKTTNLQQLTLTPLIINARPAGQLTATGKLKTSFDAAVAKTLSTLDNPESPTMGVVAYYMTLQQIVNDLPSVKEICNIHRDDLQGKIDALLR